MNLNKIVEERTQEQPQTEEQAKPQITQEQIVQSMEQILFQRMSQSEVELMKAENIQLKQTLENFTRNYRTFEDLIKSTIQKNNEVLQNSQREQNENLSKSLKEQETLLSQKLKLLQTSNDQLNQNFQNSIGVVQDNLQNSITKTTKQLTEHVLVTTQLLDSKAKDMDEKIRSFWTFNGFQTALFWSAMLAIFILTVRPTLEIFNVSITPILLKIMYPIALLPLSGFLIATLVQVVMEKIKK